MVFKKGKQPRRQPPKQVQQQPRKVFREHPFIQAFNDAGRVLDELAVAGDLV